MYATNGEKYFKIELTPEGKAISTFVQKSLNVALHKDLKYENTSLQELLNVNSSYHLVQDLEALTIGEQIERNGINLKVLSANGYGKCRVYCLTYSDKQENYNRINTAKELKEDGWKPVFLKENNENAVMISVDGKEWSLSTIKEALKNHVG